jgi:hypothetical protein
VFSKLSYFHILEEKIVRPAIFAFIMRCFTEPICMNSATVKEIGRDVDENERAIKLRRGKRSWSWNILLHASSSLRIQSRKENCFSNVKIAGYGRSFMGLGTRNC